MISNANLSFDRKCDSYSVSMIVVDGDLCEIIQGFRKQYPGIRANELAKINKSGVYYVTDYYFKSDNSHEYYVETEDEFFNLQMLV